MFVRVVKGLNANLEPNQLSVLIAKEKDMLTFDKVKCKFKWLVNTVMDRVQ